MGRAVQVQNLKKSYGPREAVRGISFAADRGRILALLGPNGAGKSTTLHMLCTTSPPDDGFAALDGLTLGRENREIRRRIGVVFQGGVLDAPLSVGENLRIRGGFYGIVGRELRERVDQVSGLAGISHLLERPYGKLSGGERRRCDIARALVHGPSILFLDEPTAGLDPEMRTAVWDSILEIRAQTEMTVVLTTHYMEEASLADDIVLMKAGRVAASGTPEELKARYSRDTLVMWGDAPGVLASMLAGVGAAYRVRSGRVEIPLRRGTPEALTLLELCRAQYAGFEVRGASLEDVYLAVMEGKKDACGTLGSEI